MKGLRGRIRTVLLMPAGAALILVSLTFYQPFFLVRAIHHAVPDVLWFAPTTRPIIALTFDDGPHALYTPQVLEILRSRQVKATFFLMGSNALKHPELVARIRRDGHLIGNHLFVDRSALVMSAREVEEALLTTEAVVGLQGACKWLRPPSGFFRPSLLGIARKHHYRVVLGSAYASDPRRPPTRYIVWAMTKMIRPGAILVFHDAGGDRSHTVAALPAIIDDARARGYRLATLDELVSR